MLRAAAATCNPRLNVVAATNAIDAAYNAVWHRAGPRTVVVVMLYPQILPRTTSTFTTLCPVGFNDTELTRVRALWHDFDALLAQRARAWGFEVADVENTFDDHLICSGSDWALGLETDESKSYHPNDAGNAAMARAVQAVLARPDIQADLQSP